MLSLKFYTKSFGAFLFHDPDEIPVYMNAYLERSELLRIILYPKISTTDENLRTFSPTQLVEQKLGSL